MISRTARKYRTTRPPRTRASNVQKHRRPRTWRLSVSALISSIMAVVGMGLLTYPTAASWISQYNQSKVTADYSAQVDGARPDARTQIAQAHAYNEALSAGAVLEANNHVPTGAGSSSDSSLSYDSILKASDDGLMARLKIPSISLDLPVYHGTADDTLLKGLGHLEGTSLPVGGEGTRSVITGHRGLAEATMFTNLDKVKNGDSLIIEVFGEVLTYRVTSTRVVEPEETEALRAEAGKDLLTLVTCTPLGINTHRILLTGERIYPTPAADVAAAGKRPEVPTFPWWVLALASGLVVVGLYLWRSGYVAARAKERALARKRDQEQEPRPQTWEEQMRSWMDDDAGVEPRRWFTDFPVTTGPHARADVDDAPEAPGAEDLHDIQELIDTTEIPPLTATRPSAGASGRTHSL
ncbi:class C sortase [Actinomyces viscosus]|uniref:Sortase (Surface protein transpeptidase) n=1 Tax=Actinomyces viscosus TaxID=1656 RepID=A0A3S4VG32_ACTVI|nr:class C sortase [Actinomyces viscosus]TFH52329.1 class C sortase [Actinomyces viscosus]VEI18765.1 Sortase (surface protein transpeptidase) [Actinomyces viscosus]